ncbi:hypothetical protein H4Q32_017095 [Labeo rohita]|uniref:BED-type domain-containing protein n=1 Tax=Labeo rohita TaxID=84645 RepID=A0ABQ8LW15_LABRO|nr:hypothetical protein H4Q32_017095 [Labeo rohita]
MSAVWQYFSLKSEKDSVAQCNTCHAQVSRGGTEPGKFNTSNLIAPLKQHHKTLHEDFHKTTELKKQSSGNFKQPTLPETLAKPDKFPRDSKKALTLTEKICQFIVLADQPLSVVSNIGFKRLIEHLEPRYVMPSRHYIVDKTIPQMHKEVKECIAMHLDKASAFSFTTDIWISDHCPLSLLSLTAHWIDADFTLQRAVLHAREFRAFNHCCKDAGFFMVFKCREENAALKECLTQHYKDPAFFEECKQEYLREKREYEQTGIPAKNRKQKLPTSM